VTASPQSSQASVLGDLGVDSDRLVSITSLHRGFLYQHLYAAPCLPRFKAAGMLKLPVEREEGLESVLPGHHL
jgi:hypothetical protein